jgi:hypothetical protein
MPPQTETLDEETRKALAELDSWMSASEQQEKEQHRHDQLRVQILRESEDQESDREDPASDDAYEFNIVPAPDLEALSHDELVGRVRGLVRQRDAGGLVAYDEIRDEVCQVNREMNRRCLQAPAFRATRKSRPRAPTEQERILTRDRMIIDLHWLHCRGQRLRLRDLSYEDLLLGDEFNFDAAAGFSSQSWKTEKRVMKIIRLTDLDQVQMGVLVSDKVRQRCIAVAEEASRLEITWRSMQQRSRRVQRDRAEDLATLWVADQYCQGTTQAVIAQMNGWITGQPPLASQSISDKLKVMRAMVKKAADVGKD